MSPSTTWDGTISKQEAMTLRILLLRKSGAQRHLLLALRYAGLPLGHHNVKVPFRILNQQIPVLEQGNHVGLGDVMVTLKPPDVGADLQEDLRWDGDWATALTGDPGTE